MELGAGESEQATRIASAFRYVSRPREQERKLESAGRPGTQLHRRPVVWCAHEWDYDRTSPQRGTEHDAHITWCVCEHREEHVVVGEPARAVDEYEVDVLFGCHPVDVLRWLGRAERRGTR